MDTSIRAAPPGALGAVMRYRVSLVPAVLLVLAILKAGDATSSGPIDADYGWHIAMGLQMLASGAIATVDNLTWTFTGQTYIATQWLGQVILAIFYNAGGEQGTLLLLVLVAAAGTLIAARTAQLHVKNATFALLVSGFTTAFLWGLFARPQILGMLAFALTVHLVELWRVRTDGRALALLPLVGVIWVNLHGSFLLGLAYIALVTFADAGPSLFDKRVGQAARIARPLVLAGAAFALATLFNPYGVGAWTNVIEIAGYRSTQSGVISEWAATSLSHDLGQAFVGFLVMFVAVWLSSRRKPTLPEGFVYVAIVLFSMLAFRNAYFGLLALTPALARGLQDSQVRDVLTSRLPQKVPLTLAAIALVAAVAAHPLIWDATHQTEEKILQHEYPVKAVAFMQRHAIQGRIYNESPVGGWITHTTGWPVFIDGRLDLFKDKFFFDWFDSWKGAPVWSSVFAKWKPEVVLVRSDAAIRQVLLAAGWTLAYEDADFSVVLPRQERYRDAIAHFERAPSAAFSSERATHNGATATLQ
jgi:hypothetical protein